MQNRRNNLRLSRGDLRIALCIGTFIAFLLIMFAVRHSHAMDAKMVRSAEVAEKDMGNFSQQLAEQVMLVARIENALESIISPTAAEQD